MMEYFDKERLEKVKTSFLEFELKYISDQELSSLAIAYSKGLKVDNNINSCIIYCLGLSDNYDPNQKCLYSVEGSGPDIDIDFSPSGRDDLIKALQAEHGDNQVARICTYKPWNLKNSLVSFSKVLQLSQGKDIFSSQSKLLFEEDEPVYGTYKDGEAIASMVPDSFRGRHTKWKDLKDDPNFQHIIKSNDRLFNLAGPIDGQPSSNSIHACGVIIHDEPLSDYIPLRKVKETGDGRPAEWFYITQWENEDLESRGFVKYDLLVIDTLEIINSTCQHLKKPFKWISEEIPLNDQKTFDLINSGHVSGLFQIEQGHVLDVILKTNPQSVEDIAAISAVIRPGPRDSGLLDDYLKYKKTGKSQNNLHPLLDTCLKETGGVMIYQEQVLEALRILSGMDLATADNVRRAMGKKKKDLMEQYHILFVKGCDKTNNISKHDADKIWNAIAAFADYGFNKSHAYAYAIITYWTAYLKANYPIEYMLTLLSSKSNDATKLEAYIKEAKLMGIEITPPHINYSHTDFSKGKDSISFGLNAIHGIGETQTTAILEARDGTDFTSIFDFYERINRTTINSRVISILAEAGAFDCFKYNREKLVERLPLIHEYYNDLTKYEESLIAVEERNREIELWQVEFDAWEQLRKDGKVERIEVDGKKVWSIERPKKPVLKKVANKPEKPDLRDIIEDTKTITLQMIEWEAQYCKFFISAHPLDFITIPESINPDNLNEITPNSQGTVLAAISQIDERKIKNGNNKGRLMATITVQDYTGYAELVIFPNQYEQYDLKVGQIVYFTYKSDSDFGSLPSLKLKSQIRII